MWLWGPCIAVCVFVCFYWLERYMVAGGHGAHTAFLFAWVDPSHTHIPKTHTHSVTPHPAKPVLTVLSHHIWAVLTGDATGQSTATCTRQRLQPVRPGRSSLLRLHLFFSLSSSSPPPALPFLPCADMILVFIRARKDSPYVYRQPHTSRNQYSAGLFIQEQD